MAGIWYGAILILLNNVWRSIRRQWQINAEQSKIDREIIDILRSLASDSYTIDGKIVDLVRSLANGLHTTAETLALEQKVQQLQTQQAELEKSGLGRLRRLLKVLFGELISAERRASACYRFRYTIAATAYHDQSLRAMQSYAIPLNPLECLYLSLIWPIMDLGATVAPNLRRVV